MPKPPFLPAFMMPAQIKGQHFLTEGGRQTRLTDKQKWEQAGLRGAQPDLRLVFIQSINAMALE